MTAATTPAAVVKPEAGSRLEALVAAYDLAYAESKKAEQALKAITDGIKLELTTAAPGRDSVDIASDLLAKPLRMQAVTSWRVDTTKFKAEQPELYVRYTKQSVAWKLSAVGPS